jgi:cellobiose-specific phosphotransferase system component IIB
MANFFSYFDILVNKVSNATIREHVEDIDAFLVGGKLLWLSVSVL